MYLRKLLLLIGTVSLLLAGRVDALGLGDIELNSALNQPLDARVSLLDVGALDNSQIIVDLASSEDFQRAGLERPFFYNQLRFNVVTDSAAGPFIAITTREPVREPYLSFIVEVRWSSGRLLREYTLLLDLPVFAGDEASPVQSTSSGVARQPVKTEPMQRGEPSRSAASGTLSAGSTYGPIQNNDTLWEIAMQVRPSGASIQQTMMAIQRANPEAFINDNINLLRRGQVLRIPPEADIRRITARQAISEVAAQNRQWSDNAMGAQLDATGRSATVERSSNQVSGRVQLAGSSSGAADNQARGSGSNDGQGEALEEELAIARDELRRAQSESSELRDRVRELEEQIETMDSLLEVTNEQMRVLELSASAGDESGDAGATAPAEAAAPVDTADTADADSTTAEAPEVDATQADEPVVDDESAAATATPAAAQEADANAEEQRQAHRVVRREPPPKTLMDHLMDNLLWLIVGVVVVLLLVVLLVRRRQEAATGADDDDAEEDIFPEPNFNLDDETAFAEDDAESESLALDVGGEDAAEEAPAQAETGDVVGEAEIYIRLGQYDQAEEMLLRALEDEPGSAAIQLKLLELYVESDNLDAFDARYGQLLQTADDQTQNRARDLRAQFVNAPEFVAPVIADSAPLIDETGDTSDSEELDYSFAMDDAEATEELDDELLADLDGEEEEPVTDSFELDDDFTFDLEDEPEDAGSTPATDAELVSPSTTSYDLSFDGGSEEAAEELESAETSDFSFDLELDDNKKTSEDDSASSIELQEETDLAFDLDDVAEEATSESDEDDLLFSLDDKPESTEVASEESLDLEEEPTASSIDSDDLMFDSEEQVPTLDLADDEADDFDLDSAMGDVDMDALDQEMSGLDESPATGVDTVEEPADETFSLNDLPTPEESNLAAGTASAESLGDYDDMDFFAEADEAATKLDLARAYMDMGDMDGARDILSEVVEEGNDEQKREAQTLLERVES